MPTSSRRLSRFICRLGLMVPPSMKEEIATSPIEVFQIGADKLCQKQGRGFPRPLKNKGWWSSL